MADLHCPKCGAQALSRAKVLVLWPNSGARCRACATPLRVSASWLASVLPIVLVLTAAEWVPDRNLRLLLTVVASAVSMYWYLRTVSFTRA